MYFRLLLTLHRWVGVALCVLFLIWFASGIGMIYWTMPSISVRDRLSRAEALKPASIALSPTEAARIAGAGPEPEQVRLTTYDGRPAYRFASAGGIIIYADTGEEQFFADDALRGRAAAAWSGQPLSAARVTEIDEPDQWIVGSALRNLRPLWKYSWPSGDDVYVGETGDVLLHTTTVSRLKAYASAIPHWLYFTPLRKHQPFWIRFATYTAMVGTAGAVFGAVIGVWMYSPRQRYRYAGLPSRIPYRGQKRWHMILGLVFGTATITWTLSGSLAFLPFPTPRPAPTTMPTTVQAQAQAGQRQPGRGPRLGRGGGDQSLASALRGQAGLPDFDALHPRAALTALGARDVKELAFTSFAGTPLYSAILGDGTSVLLSIDGKEVDGFDPASIVDIVKRSAADPGRVETTTVEEYDYYYLDRTRQSPLPVILARMNDSTGTRHYIDPKTGTIVGTYNERNWARRFFYNGLHSLSFPWLYNHRPLWDIVVITFMIGGMTLSTTALVLAWRVLEKKLRRYTPGS